MDWNAGLPMVTLIGLAVVGALAIGISEASKRNMKRVDAKRRWSRGGVHNIGAPHVTIIVGY